MKALKLIIGIIILSLICSCASTMVMPDGCKAPKEKKYKMIEPTYDKKVKL